MTDAPPSLRHDEPFDARARLERLQAVTAALAGAATLDDVAAAVLDEGLGVVGAHEISISRLEGDSLRLVRAVGYPPDVVASLRRVALTHLEPAREVLAGGEPRYYRSPDELARRHPTYDDVAGRPGGGARALLPLTSRGGPLGLLWVVWDEAREVGADERAFLEAIARQCAQAMGRVLAADALEESVERHRHVFQGVGVSIWEEDFTDVAAALAELRARGVVDVRAHCAEHPEFVARAVGLVRILGVNDATLRMFGARDRAELLTSLHRIFVPETAPVFVEELVAVAEGRTLLEAEAPMRTLAGERLDVLFALSLPPAGGRYDRVLVTLTDVTARKAAEAAVRESEERFRNMADHAPVMLWVTDAGGTCTYLSKGWYEFTGQTDATGLGLGWLSAVHPDDAPGAGETFRAANARREAFRLDYRLRRADGAYRWAIDAAAPRFGSRGEFLGYVGSVIDIADRKAAEAEREASLARERQARAQAEEASRLKDEFLATVSHELRTPLNAILGWAHMLRAGGLPADRRRGAIETIERNARAQAQLIDDLLDVNRIMSGKLRLEVAPVELARVVEGAIETVRPAAEAKGVRLQAALDPAGVVMGDAHRLGQVVWNLLSNAVKFTPRGGRVQVVIERRDSSVYVTVADTGKGIAPAFLPHLFERFRQEDAGTTRRYGGLGLGLSIVRQLVELHGGEAAAASGGEGKGAAFTVRLPLALARRQEAPPPPALAAAEARAGGFEWPPGLEGLRLLVVDDEADARELLRALLEGCGARVTAAASAAEALAALGRERPEVLVSDIGMPGEDGYALIGKVRALPPGDGGATPAVALTAYARAEDRARVLLAGFQSHVPKPVEPIELFAVVASLARGGRARRP